MENTMRTPCSQQRTHEIQDTIFGEHVPFSFFYSRLYSKSFFFLSYYAAPQQLWIIYSYAKCAQISELEPIITVRRPHRQRMSSAANALLCNIGEGKQCNLLSYFSALQHLCGTRNCGKRARKGHFHGHE